MPVFIASLNSGSNANCYYAGTEREAILIDAGLSCRETERRMKLLGLEMEKVKALFISHEHADHITGMTSLSRKYRMPVYITPSTWRNCQMNLEQGLVRSFTHAKPVRLGEWTIVPFRKSHDADDPHSFMASAEGVNIGIITDIGYACKRVIKYFGQCDAAFLESNYCEQMLADGDYPYYLKKRISGDRGHLSNTQALELFRDYRSESLRLLILSHLSKNNNEPARAESLFKPHAGNTKIVVASRYAASEVFCVEKNSLSSPVKASSRRARNKNQLSLFP